MSVAARKVSNPRSMRRRENRGRPLGQILVASGRLAQSSLDYALDMQLDTGGPLGQILVAHQFNSPEEICEALAAQSGGGVAVRDCDFSGPVPGAPEFWIKTGCMPWAKTKTGWKVAASNPRNVEKHRDEIAEYLGKFDIIWASHEQIQTAQTKHFRGHLLSQSENGLAEDMSCRNFSTKSARWWVLGIITLAIGAIIFSQNPLILFHGALVMAMIGIVLSVTLKISILAAKPANPQDKVYFPDPIQTQMIWPTISILVPLFRETKIAERLVERLKMLDYPRSHLDVILLLEESDPQTQMVLTRTALPSWMRIIEVPKGSVQTKPRAMNYALPFCKGEIIGIYDAEDAPEPDQLVKVATQFAQSSPDTVCLQGRLDFYNTHSNWMARCFTIEYASWFRMILPRLVSLGGVIPLGGTTLFFRKAALISLGGWDAHNVTEDADLGVRLARAGYRCDILDSTTFEEANNRPIAWIKQRSRWLKGYLITYLLHMKNPRKLLADLGTRKFFMFQLVFLNTLIGFSIAPVFWILWIIAIGAIGFDDLGLNLFIYRGISVICMTSFVIEMIVNTIAVRQSGHIALSRWIITTLAYFPMGSFAIYKGFWELLTAPFYWDKTDHG